MKDSTEESGNTHLCGKPVRSRYECKIDDTMYPLMNT